MDEYRKTVFDTLQNLKEDSDKSKLIWRQLLEIVIKNWGVRYDLQLRKNMWFVEGKWNCGWLNKEIFLIFTWINLNQEIFTELK